MNILFFLTPKSKIKFVYSDMSVRQVLEVFEHYRYQVICILNRDGSYNKTISEGDLLYFVKNNISHPIETFEQMNIGIVPTYRAYEPVRIDTDIKTLYQTILNQNFVPILDDRNLFIGIVTRKSVLDYLTEKGKSVLENLKNK